MEEPTQVEPNWDEIAERSKLMIFCKIGRVLGKPLSVHSDHSEIASIRSQPKFGHD